MKEIERTLTHEGGYSNDPDDAGKETKYGISKKSFPQLDIKNLTQDAAVDIYIRRYWNPMKIGLLNSIRVRFKVFDIGVNLGTGTAIRFLQDIVKSKPDGVMGQVTADLANAMSEEVLLDALMKKQILRYSDIVVNNSKDLKYLHGWITRAYDCGEGL